MADGWVGGFVVQPSGCFVPRNPCADLPAVSGVCCGDQRPAQPPRFGWRDDGGIGAVKDDLALSVPVRVLQPDDGYHDIGASPVVGGVLDSPLGAVECPEGRPIVVPFVDQGPRWVVQGWVSWLDRFRDPARGHE